MMEHLIFRIMKKELSVTMNFGTKVRVALQSVGEGLAKVYSSLLEEPISVKQAWKILHASVALSFAVFTSCSVFAHFILVTWFLFTIWDCKRAGLK